MSLKPTVEDEIRARIKRMGLFRVMKQSQNYEDDQEIIDTILKMRERVRGGEDPEEVLYEEGFEPDDVFDLL